MKKNILFIMLIMSALWGKAQTFISGTIMVIQLLYQGQMI